MKYQKNESLLKRLLGRSGVSLIETLIASGILASVGVGVFLLTSQETKIESRSSLAPGIKGFNSQIVYGIKTLLINTHVYNEDDDGNVTKLKQAGLCRLIESKGENFGVGKVNMNIFPAKGGDFPFKNVSSEPGYPVDTWGPNFPGWNIVDSIPDFCESDNYTKCLLQQEGQVMVAADKKRSVIKVRAKAEIIPVSLNPLKGGKIFDRIALPESGVESYPVGDVGFILRSTVRYVEGKVNKGNEKQDQEKDSVLNNFVWGGDIGHCDKLTRTGDYIKLAITGTGFGDPSGKILYNNQFLPNGDLPPLDIFFRAAQVTSGLKTSNDDGGQTLVTDSQSLIAHACNEKKFACPGTPYAERVYGRIASFSSFNYVYPNSVTEASNIDFTGAFKIEKVASSGSRETIAYTNSEMNTSIAYRFDGQVKDTLAGSLKGTHLIESYLYDSDSNAGVDGTANNLCRKICSEDVVNGSSKIVASMDYNFPAFPGAGDIHRDAFDFGCNACYTKSCARIGLGTFGPMKNMPLEALDSVIPECASKLVQADQDNDPYPSVAIPGAGDPTRGCIAAELVDGEIKLGAFPCADKKPVVCFNYGQFILADEIGDQDANVKSYSYAEAQAACFNSGREIVKTENIKGLFGSQGENEPSTLQKFPQVSRVNQTTRSADQYYDFVNVAKQGLFIPFQTVQQENGFISYLASIGISSGQFWLGLKKDSANETVMDVPVSQAFLSNAIGSAMYSNPFGNVRAMVFDTELPSQGNSAEKGLLLFNDVKFRGGVPVKPVSPMESKSPLGFRFLCREKVAPHAFFVTDGSFEGQNLAHEGRSQSQVDGELRCQDEGGLFLPPTTMLGWVKAMRLTRPNASDYPFPDPQESLGDDAIKNMDPVWVALTGDVNGQNWALYPTERVKNILSTAQAPESNMIDAQGRYVDGSSVPTHIACKDLNSGSIVTKPFGSSCGVNAYQITKDLLSGAMNILNKKLFVMASVDIEASAVIELGDTGPVYPPALGNQPVNQIIPGAGGGSSGGGILPGGSGGGILPGGGSSGGGILPGGGSSGGSVLPGGGNNGGALNL